MSKIPSSYDPIAGMYHALWADWYLPAALPALDNLLFSRIPASSLVLDLCCGSGHVTRELVRRGYRVTGIDSSAQLIALAKNELPGVDFRVQDARYLELESKYDAALSTFDSLNHILSMEDLRQVFTATHNALSPFGLFVFDMNLEEAYSADLREWSVNIADNSVGLVRGEYDPVSSTAETELIWFVKTGQDELWKRHRSTVKQRCYAQAEILIALREAGFTHIEAISAKDAGVSSELGFGRVYFSARA